MKVVKCKVCGDPYYKDAIKKHEWLHENPLPENQVISESECFICGAHGVPHSPACPKGERYKRVQDIGGVPCKVMTEAEMLEYFLN